MGRRLHPHRPHRRGPSTYLVGLPMRHHVAVRFLGAVVSSPGHARNRLELSQRNPLPNHSVAPPRTLSVPLEGRCADPECKAFNALVFGADDSLEAEGHD